MAKGIDVSVHNGNINWGAVKADGVEFAIIRAGYGRTTSQEDDKFRQNYTNARAVGLPVGTYWYNYAKTVEDAKREAAACIDVLAARRFDFPVYYDVEEQNVLALGREKVSAIIKAFCEELEKAGYYVGVYTGASAAKSCLTEEIRKAYDLWIAHWGVSQPSYDLYGVWQYTDSGSVDGINGHVDMDESYKDYPAIMAANGLNNYPKPNVEPVKPVAPVEADTVDITITLNGKTYKGTLKGV